MIIQEQLYKRIEALVNSKRNDPKYEDLRFKLTRSKSTKSVYITILTKVNKDILKTTYRISDHYNSKVKTKVVKRATNFNFITRKINNMIKQVRTMRYYKLVENVCQNNEQE